MQKRLKKRFLEFIQMVLSSRLRFSMFLIVLILPVVLGFLIIGEKKGATGTEFNVDVVPLVRSAYLEFRLDLLPSPPPELYNPSNMPIMQIPETHKASLFWKESGTTEWKEAQPFVHVQDGNYDPAGIQQAVNNSDPRMVSMIFGLLENSIYDYKVEFQGAGYPITPIIGSFKTLSSTIVAGSNKTILNNSMNIRNAIWSILDSGSPAGKTLEFASTDQSNRAVFRDSITGYYDNRNFVGTPENWVTVQGKEGHEIIFDGSDPDYDVANQGLWMECNSSNNFCNKTDQNITDNSKIFRTTNQYYDPARQSDIPFDRTKLRNYPNNVFYETEQDGDSWILQNVTKGSGCGAAGVADTCVGSTWQGLKTLSFRASHDPQDGMFANEDGYIYVRLRYGLNPNNLHIKIPALDSPILLAQDSYVVFRNLTLQYFRTYHSFYIANSHDVLIDNIRIKGTLHAFGAGSDIYSPKRNIIVKNCNFSVRGLNPEYNEVTGTWNGTNWNYIKATPEETAAVNTLGTAVSILDSTIEGYNGGITSGGVYAWEIDNNKIGGVSDDAIEIEGQGAGIAITRNRLDGNYKSVSLAPVLWGPHYYIRNISVQRGEYPNAYKQAPLKFGNNPDNYGFDIGLKFFANNTLINVNKNPIYQNLSPGFDQSGPTANIEVINNYVVSSNMPMNLSDDSRSCYPQIFDHNLYIETRADLPFGSQPPDTFAFVGPCHYQGDVSDMRQARKFEDWQSGTNTRSGSTNWPTTPSDSTYHSTKHPWIHDPNGKFLPYYNQDAPTDYNLINPTHAFDGDFTPKLDSPNVAMGMDLANITYDVGPGWAAYEEPKGMATVGALPAENGTDPIVSLSSSASTYENVELTIEPSVLSASTFLWSKVNEADPIEFIFGNSTKNVTIKSTSVTGKDNSYRLKLAVTSSSGVVSDDNYIDIHVHKLADINGDNSINFTDFSVLLSSWGTPSNPMANIVRTGTSATKVDFQDFSVLLSKWGG